jgi:hypothetical protein
MLLKLLKLLPLLQLFLKQTFELALLQVTCQDLSLLALVHLTKLAELIVLKETESLQVRNPLSSNLLKTVSFRLILKILLLVFISLSFDNIYNILLLLILIVQDSMLQFLKLLLLYVNKLLLFSSLKKFKDAHSLTGVH